LAAYPLSLPTSKQASSNRPSAEYEKDCNGYDRTEIGFSVVRHPVTPSVGGLVHYSRFEISLHLEGAFPNFLPLPSMSAVI
jgi:hypothetical protein